MTAVIMEKAAAVAAADEVVACKYHMQLEIAAAAVAAAAVPRSLLMRVMMVRVAVKLDA